jgi:hypothetical protein
MILATPVIHKSVKIFFEIFMTPLKFFKKLTPPLQFLAVLMYDVKVEKLNVKMKSLIISFIEKLLLICKIFLL